jgi:hypothetical protein
MSPNHRIMAWRSPAGKLVIALTTGPNVVVGTSQGPALQLTVPSYSIEFWVQN